MKTFGILASAGIVALMIGCGGQPAQQADSTATPAATTPAPAETPATTPAQEPAQQQAPAATPPPASKPAYKPPSSTPPQQNQAATPAPTPVAPPKPQMVAVAPGTTMTLALDAAVTSKSALVGDAFTATVVESVSQNGIVVIPEASLVHGTVTEVHAAKHGAGKAKLVLAFNSLKLPDGYETPIKGTFQEMTASNKGKNAAIIGGSAAGGALLGRILGKNTKSAVIGAVVAGGIGTAVVTSQEGEQAKIPRDTPFKIKLEEEIQVPHMPARS